MRHLTDCIRGEYRDRIMVRHAELRMYTVVMQKFEDFQFTVRPSAAIRCCGKYVILNIL